MPSRSVLLFALTLGIAGGPSDVAAQAVHENVAVEVITIRLTARDHSGRRVEDLTAADLSVTVDGKPVAIETFVPPARGNGVVSSAEDAASTPDAGSRSAPGGRLVRTMIFVDYDETHPFDRRDVCDELDRFIRAPGSVERELMVALYSGGRMRVECPWTSDPDLAAAAVHRIRQGSGPGRPVPAASAVGGNTGPTGFASATWIQLHTDGLHEALLEALAAFPDTPAERRLLVVSGGSAMMRPQDLAAVLRCQMTPGERTRLSATSTDVAAAHAREIERATFALWTRAVNPVGDALTMSDVVAKALERDVAVIPVLAEAMDRGDMDLGIRGAGVGTAGAGQLSAHIAVGQVMTEIAESTGAEPILVPRKTASRLAEIGTRAVYTLTFREPVGDHRYHRVAMKCRRPGLSMAYRRGYRIPIEDERTLDTVVARFLQAGEGANPMNASAVQSEIEGRSGRAATRLVVRYMPPLETGAGDDREVQIIAVGEDGDGDRTEPIAWSGAAHRGEVSGEFVAKVILGNPRDAYRWSLAVRDQPTGLTSYVFVPPPGRP